MNKYLILFIIIPFLICCTEKTEKMKSESKPKSETAINTVANDPRNIAGYSKTKWGMTIDEVLKAEAPRAIIGGKTSDNRDYVTINNIDISRTKFNAKFYFDKDTGKLNLVALEGQEHNRLVNDEIISSIGQLLTEKYGQPTFKDNRRVSWKLPNTSITLHNLNAGAGLDISVVIIVYESTTSRVDEARNL